MEITSVKVRKVEKENSRMKAMVSINIDDILTINGMRIIEGDNGLFVAMPSRKTLDGYRDYVHPINQEGRDIITKAVLDEYNKAE